MATSITFPPATLSRLQAEAEKRGKNINTLVIEAVEAKLARSHLTFQDVLRPIQEAVAFFAQELAAMRAERKSPRN